MLTSSSALLICSRRPAAAAVRRLSSTPGAPLKLYGFPLSQPVRSVLLLCHSADIKYDTLSFAPTRCCPCRIPV